MKLITIILLLSFIACSPETETRAALVYKVGKESRWLKLEPGDTLIFGTDTFLVRETEQQFLPSKYRTQSTLIKF